VVKRYTRKELKQPDQFQTFWGRVYEVLKDSSRQITIGVIVTVVVIVGVLVGSSLYERRGVESSKALGRAVRILNSENTPHLEDAEAQAEAEDDVPKFKTEKERREAALAELDKVVKEWGSTAAGKQALLVRAGVLLDLGRLDEARRDYEAFLATRPRGQLKAVAHEGLGYVFEAKGEFDRALEEFRKSLGGGEFYKDRALYNQARILERKGDGAAAKKLYQEILDTTPTTPLRDDINNRLALLSR